MPASKSKGSANSPITLYSILTVFFSFFLTILLVIILFFVIRMFNRVKKISKDTKNDDQNDTTSISILRNGLDDSNLEEEYEKSLKKESIDVGVPMTIRETEKSSQELSSDDKEGTKKVEEVKSDEKAKKIIIVDI